MLLVAGVLGALAFYDRELPPASGWLERARLQPQFETVDGHRLRFVRAGAGPAVVLVHGFGSSLDTWRDVLPGLATDHEVVALDLPGFGESDRPADLAADELPRAVLGLMDRLRVTRAALVGSSMGGATVVLVAAQQPDRASALVLIDSAGFELGPSGWPGLLRIATSRLGGLLARLPGQRLFVARALHEVFHDPRLVTPERLAPYLAAAGRPGTFEAWRSLRLSLDGRPGLVREALGRIRAPALVVWGRDDAWLPVSDADRFAAAIAGARRELIEGSGHLPQEERPRELLRLLRSFLASASRGW